MIVSVFFLFFFFNDTATTEIYTLSLHDALPISIVARLDSVRGRCVGASGVGASDVDSRDRKSTRLNSSHSQISYAVFCLKKKKKKTPTKIKYFEKIHTTVHQIHSTASYYKNLLI